LPAGCESANILYDPLCPAYSNLLNYSYAKKKCQHLKTESSSGQYQSICFAGGLDKSAFPGYNEISDKSDKSEYAHQSEVIG